MFAWAAKLTPYGGADRKAIKRIVKDLKKENKKRALYAQKRKAVIAQHSKAAVQARRLAKLRWAVVNKGDPGVFLGTIGGVRGYWRRSERLLAPERQAIIGNARGREGHIKGQRGRLSWTKPGSHPQLLVALARDTKYKGIFDYHAVVNRAFAEEMTPEKLASSLDYYLKKQRMLSGG